MEKHKSLWTKKEESELCHEMRLDRPLEEIAKKHQRSQKAIELRFALVLQRALAEGEKMFTLQKEYRITEQAIKRYLDMLQETKTTEPTPMDPDLLMLDDNTLLSKFYFSKKEKKNTYM